MIALLVYGGCALLGLLAGRAAGGRAWLLLPALVLLSVVVALVSDPFVAVAGVLAALAAVPGIAIGLLLRRRARSTGPEPAAP